MNKLIEYLKKLISSKTGLKFTTLARADDILEDFFSSAGKLEEYSKAKATLASEVQDKVDLLEKELEDHDDEVTQALKYATKIRGLLND